MAFSLPKISVVTPSYNQAKFLKETILSVIAQSYPNLEYIVLDGGSTDGSVQIIEDFDHKISYWRSEPDDGQYHAIQEGLKRASGDLMFWINSDDKMHPKSLFRMAYLATKYPEVDCFTGRHNVLNPKGRFSHSLDELSLWNQPQLVYEFLSREQHKYIPLSYIWKLYHSSE